MKKLSIIFFLILFFPSIGHTALPAGAAWEVRTTGNDNNGGCYDIANDGGTDYSQQDSAQLSLTDLAMATGGTTLTSVTGGFTAAMVDNCIQITAGTNFTTGFYEITTYTDTNTVTLDRDATNGSNASSGTGAVGGGLLTIDKPFDGAVGDNTIYVQAGAYSEAVTTPDLSNSASTPLTLEGYKTTHGDNPTGTNRPKNDCADACVPFTFDTSYLIVKNIVAAQSTGHGFTSAGDSDSEAAYFINSRSTDNAADGWAAGTNREWYWLGCEADLNGDDGISAPDEKGYVFSSHIHSNTGTGLVEVGAYYSIIENNGASGIFEDRGVVVLGNLIYENTGDGSYTTNVNTGGFVYYYHNTIADNSDDGFDHDVWDNWGRLYFNNILYSNTSNAIESSTEIMRAYSDYNIFYDNGSLGITLGDNDSTSDPNLTDPSNDDYTLSSSSTNALNAAYNAGELFKVDWKTNIGSDQDDNATGGTATTSYGFSN